MAENGINGHKSGNIMQWKVGLMNNKLKYLTAETFGYKVNASGTALKKKQIWCIEQERSQEQKQAKDEPEFVYIRSHLGMYMSSNKYGEVTVDKEEAGMDERFTVEYSKDGKWAFKHLTHGNYLTGAEEHVKCFEKKNTNDDIWWSIQLYNHPQVSLRNVCRKRYVHLNKENNLIECTEPVPWGADALITMDFIDGKYTMKSCDNRLLNRDGTLQDAVDENTMFTMEIHSGCLAFKDYEGKYLCGVNTGILKTKKVANPKGDELFTIEDSHPQVQIVSHTGKSVSIKQGLDVSANQPTDEIEDTEIFQLEFDKASESWAVRSSKDMYWNLQASGTVQIKKATDKNSYFNIEWQDDGTVGIKGSDGKYLSNKPTGILFSSSDVLEDCNKFKVIIVNRPLLVLKSEFGFVGMPAKGDQYMCNKSKYDMLSLSPAVENGSLTGYYTIKGPDGKYVSVNEENMVCSDPGPTKFQLVFQGQSQLAIRAPNKCYLKGEQNGLFKAVSEEICLTALWEY